jgi:hypothetical protein
MLNLFRKNRIDIEAAYIITVKDNANSEQYSARCQQSCLEVGMPYKVWPAYDGTIKERGIVPPIQMRNDSVMNMLKITDHYLTRGEVACALSHISLWVHCALIDQPIVILEHDTLMYKKFETIDGYNTIVYLGGSEWKDQNWPMVPIPPHASEGPNYHFICRAHAYAIDPAVAKNLLSYVITHGIDAPLDIMMRVDLFNISHQGLYASDVMSDLSDTTIAARPTAGRTTQRNDNLEW